MTAVSERLWADIVGLDNSQDGINLLVKKSMSLESSASVLQQTSMNAAWSKENPFMKKIRDENWIRTKNVSKVSGLRVDESNKTMLSISEESTSITIKANGMSNRKRLACDITRTPTKSRKESKPVGVSVEATEQVEAHVAPVDEKQRVLKPSSFSWADLAEDDDEPSTAVREAEFNKPTVVTKQVEKSNSNVVGVNEEEETVSEKEDVASESASSQGDSFKASVEIEELTPERIEKRQRAIDIGKATQGYQNYVARVKTDERSTNRKLCPSTPDKNEHISRRLWNSKIRHWRITLHRWDNADEAMQSIHRVPRAKKNRINLHDKMQFPNL